jgi:phosphoglycerol transferase MdoB-like AlkP superfamily enzyme
MDVVFLFLLLLRFLLLVAVKKQRPAKIAVPRDHNRIMGSLNRNETNALCKVHRRKAKKERKGFIKQITAASSVNAANRIPPPPSPMSC